MVWPHRVRCRVLLSRRCCGMCFLPFAWRTTRQLKGIGPVHFYSAIAAIIKCASVVHYSRAIYTFSARYSWRPTLYLLPSSFRPAIRPCSSSTRQASLPPGFLMRSIGSWFFGRIADKRGLRVSMMIAVTMMCGGSLIVALLPTYASIGVAAPALLLVARLLQGSR